LADAAYRQMPPLPAADLIARTVTVNSACGPSRASSKTTGSSKEHAACVTVIEALH
jgi:hypothetical protein